MSQHDLHAIIRQQQEQLTAMQAQLQAIQVEGAAEIPRPNTGFNTEVARPQVFDGSLGKVLEFIMACRLYIRMKMREEAIKEQIQCILLYIQGVLWNTLDTNNFYFLLFF